MVPVPHDPETAGHSVATAIGVLRRVVSFSMVRDQSVTTRAGTHDGWERDGRRGPLVEPSWSPQTSRATSNTAQ